MEKKEYICGVIITGFNVLFMYMSVEFGVGCFAFDQFVVSRVSSICNIHCATKFLFKFIMNASWFADLGFIFLVSNSLYGVVGEIFMFLSDGWQWARGSKGNPLVLQICMFDGWPCWALESHTPFLRLVSHSFSREAERVSQKEGPCPCPSMSMSLFSTMIYPLWQVKDKDLLCSNAQTIVKTIFNIFLKTWLGNVINDHHTAFFNTYAQCGTSLPGHHFMGQSNLLFFFW